MRTADPQNIKNDFLAGLQEIQEVFAAVDAPGVGILVAQKYLVAEYTFLGASILLEGFISDLFVAYINKEPDVFVQALTASMELSSTDEFGKRAIQFTSTEIKSHLTLDKIREILDPKEYNVTFPYEAEMKKRAGMWLSVKHRGYFNSMQKPDYALIDSTKSVRNYLAHRSTSAKKAMQIALADPNLPVEFRRKKNNIEKVGYFLHSSHRLNAISRLSFYLDSLKAIAEKLCPKP
ncbi:hypothetical protein [Pseudomonas sp. NBRC 111129]|uniref:hypothetical protein n=1 Tax=Pseudomonas sp. NBRC 111129 TaxID=1661044 RepID=UPI0006D3E3D5|nr:hypothetical protein [Pseudomonas sp. NBRC 111129]